MISQFQAKSCTTNCSVRLIIYKIHRANVDLPKFLVNAKLSNSICLVDKYCEIFVPTTDHFNQAADTKVESTPNLIILGKFLLLL